MSSDGGEYLLADGCAVTSHCECEIGDVPVANNDQGRDRLVDLWAKGSERLQRTSTYRNTRSPPSIRESVSSGSSCRICVGLSLPLMCSITSFNTYKREGGQSSVTCLDLRGTFVPTRPANDTHTHTHTPSRDCVKQPCKSSAAKLCQRS
jgi:hypothetical protein